MGPGGIATIIAATSLFVIAIAVAYAVVRVSRLVDEARASLHAFTEETTPLLEESTRTLELINSPLESIARITKNVEEVSSKVSAVKEVIVAEAEKLATSTDWVATARRFKALMDQWKAAGRGKKNDDTKLWNRFKAAQDQFFAAKNADLEKREVSMGANLAKREELIVKIEAILPFTDVKAAKNSFREVSREWEKIGITNRDKRAALDARVSVVEDAIKAAEAEIWRKTDPAAKARAQEVVAQLSESIASYQKAAEKAKAAGNDKKAKEALESAEARKAWLVEAEKSLAEFN